MQPRCCGRIRRHAALLLGVLALGLTVPDLAEAQSHHRGPEGGFTAGIALPVDRLTAMLAVGKLIGREQTGATITK